MFLSNKKGQTSLEYLIIFTVICLISAFFITSIYSTFDINRSLYKIKHKTIELLTEYDSTIVISKMNYSVVDKNLNISLNLNQINTTLQPLELIDYNLTLTNLLNTTKFENINLLFNYIS